MKGQMHCMLSTLQSAGRSLKKKMHRVSAQMYLRATVQDGLLKDTPAAKVQIGRYANMANITPLFKMAFQG
jgi:hypothetical protein